jgi:hypothetical protein
VSHLKNKILNETLMDAVAAFDVQRVKDALAQGADPNYIAEREDENPDDPVQPSPGGQALDV